MSETAAPLVSHADILPGVSENDYNKLLEYCPNLATMSGSELQKWIENRENEDKVWGVFANRGERIYDAIWGRVNILKLASHSQSTVEPLWNR